MSRKTLTFFHTGDIHGRDEQSARLFSFYRRLRSRAEEAGHEVFLFDAGDPSDRCREYCALSRCAAYAPILNRFGYDGGAVGNDIGLVYGMEALAEAGRRLDFPVFAANLTRPDGSLTPGVCDRRIFNAGGVKVGIFGLTSPWRGAYREWGLSPKPYVETAREQVEALEAEGAELVVFLSHMGLSEDLEIIEEAEGIDVVLGGHSHTDTPGGIQFSRRRTILNHTGDYARKLGRVEIVFDSGSRKVIERRAETLPVPGEELPSPEILAAIGEARAEGARLGARVLGRIEEALPLDHFSPSPFGVFAAGVLQRYFQADAAILSSGCFHNGLLPGKVTLAALNRACFAPMNPEVSEMTGAALLKALDRGRDKALIGWYHRGLRGVPVGVPQLANIRVDSARGEETVFIGDEPLDPEKKYRIAHTDLESDKKLGYLPAEGRVTLETHRELILREVLERAF